MKDESDYCPECWCDTHKDKWDVYFIGGHEYIYCPLCQYRERIDGNNEKV